MKTSITALTVTMAAVTLLLVGSCRPTRPETPSEMAIQERSTTLCTYQLEPDPIEQAPLVPDSFRPTCPVDVDRANDVPAHKETRSNDRPISRLKRWIQHFREKRELRKKRRAERKSKRHDRKAERREKRHDRKDARRSQR